MNDEQREFLIDLEADAPISVDMYFDGQMTIEWCEISECVESTPLEYLSDGLCDLLESDQRRFNRLLFKAITTISADDLCELRDILRSTIVDAARDDVIHTYKKNEWEISFDTCVKRGLTPDELAREHGVYAAGDPHTGN